MFRFNFADLTWLTLAKKWSQIIFIIVFARNYLVFLGFLKQIIYTGCYSRFNMVEICFTMRGKTNKHFVSKYYLVLKPLSYFTGMCFLEQITF